MHFSPLPIERCRGTAVLSVGSGQRKVALVSCPASDLQLTRTFIRVGADQARREGLRSLKGDGMVGRMRYTTKGLVLAAAAIGSAIFAMTALAGSATGGSPDLTYTATSGQDNIISVSVNAVNASPDSCPDVASNRRARTTFRNSRLGTVGRS